MTYYVHNIQGVTEIERCLVVRVCKIYLTIVYRLMSRQSVRVGYSRCENKRET